MSDIDPRTWAEAVAQALTIEGERVPFQRVLSDHRAGLESLRARGLTWRSLAHLLTRAGVRRPDGLPYGADHLRVCTQRMSTPVVENRSVAIRPSHDLRSLGRSTTSATILQEVDSSPTQSPLPRARRRSPPQEASPQGDKDVSDDELAVARARLNQLRK